MSQKQFGEIQVNGQQLQFMEFMSADQFVGIVTLPGSGTKIQMAANSRGDLVLMLTKRAKRVMAYEDPENEAKIREYTADCMVNIDTDPSTISFPN